MLGGGSPREELFADEALAHVLTDDNEHLANLVGAGAARASLEFVSSAVMSISNESRTYKFVTNALRLNSTAQPQQNQQR